VPGTDQPLSGDAALQGSASTLGRAAKAFRAVHAAIAVVDLAALGYVWHGAIRRRRGRLLSAAVVALAAEGVALVVGRGNCPLGPLQRRLGDPMPLFELVLPPRAAKAAVPLLSAISVTGIALAAARRPAATPLRLRGRQRRGTWRAG
jgi:hypothetical protein